MDGTPWSAELLDYLTADFVDSGYDVKKLLRLIATSQIYQVRCVPPQESLGGDAPAFSGPVARRLTAEQFIDAVWRITGTAPNKSDSVDGKKPSGVFDARGNEPVRASIMKCDLLMRLLGRPNREQVVTTRPDDLSTLQALDLTNGPTMSNLLARGAANLRKNHPERSPDDTIQWLYRATLCRAPTAEELKIARQSLGDPMTDEGLADLLWCLFELPEFQLVE